MNSRWNTLDWNAARRFTAVTVMFAMLVVAGSAFGAERGAGGVTIVHTIPFAGNWQSRDITWDGEHLWLADNRSSLLIEIDPVTGEVVSSIDAPESNPFGLASDGTNLYNANFWSEPELDDTFYTLSTSGQVVNGWPVPDSPNASPNGAAYAPETGHIWLSDTSSDSIYELDPADGSVLSSFAFPGQRPRGIAWCNGRIVAVDDIELALYELEPDGTVVSTVSIAFLGEDPIGLTFDGRYLWVSENETDALYRIDAGIGPDPTADIRVNGQDGPLELTTADALTVSVALDPGIAEGDRADWWLSATRDSAITWWGRYDGSGVRWMRAGAPIRLSGGRLQDVASLDVLGPLTLPPGEWTFRFAVDDNRDGVFDGSFSDEVVVTIE